MATAPASRTPDRSRSAGQHNGTRPPERGLVWIRRWWATYHWWVVAGSAVLAAGLGFVGFRAYLGPSNRSTLDFIYLSLQLFVLESGDITAPAPPSLEIARLLAPAVAAYALAAVAAAVFQDELTGLRTRFKRGHVIICGLEAGSTLARMLLANDEHIVAIERNPSHPRIETCRAQHIPVFIGDARDEQLLRKAGVKRARRLFAVCGDDGVNMKVAEQARRLAAGRRETRFRPMNRPLRVLVHVADPYLCSLLMLQEMDRADTHEATLDFFSLYSGGARALLSQYGFTGATAGHAHTPHIVIVGLGRLGQQLVVQAARNWRSEDHLPGDRLWITVVDEGSAQRLAWLRQRHPLLDQTCELDNVDLPPDPLSLLQSSQLAAAGRPPISNVFVCLAEDAQGLGVGLALHRALKHRGVPVVVRSYDADVAALLPGVQDGEATAPYVFDQFDRTCHPEQLFAGEAERLAQALHEAYVRQQRPTGATVESNPSMVAWAELPKDKKDANRAQAMHTMTKLASIGCEMRPLTRPDAELFSFSMAETEHLARMEHERWMAEADPEHPANIPWDNLSDEVREIDRNFIRRMPALLASAGFEIDRLSRGAVGDALAPSTAATTY